MLQALLLLCWAHEFFFESTPCADPPNTLLLFADPAIALLGGMQSLFQASMYSFVVPVTCCPVSPLHFSFLY
jgi:hypothetical protein